MHCHINHGLAGHAAHIMFVHMLLLHSEHAAILINRTAEVTQMIQKYIFWSIIDSSSLYAAGVTRIQVVVLRRIG